MGYTFSETVKVLFMESRCWICLSRRGGSMGATCICHILWQVCWTQASNPLAMPSRSQWLVFYPASCPA